MRSLCCGSNLLFSNSNTSTELSTAGARKLYLKSDADAELMEGIRDFLTSPSAVDYINFGDGIFAFLNQLIFSFQVPITKQFLFESAYRREANVYEIGRLEKFIKMARLRPDFYGNELITNEEDIVRKLKTENILLNKRIYEDFLESQTVLAEWSRLKTEGFHVCRTGCKIGNSIRNLYASEISSSGKKVKKSKTCTLLVATTQASNSYESSAPLTPFDDWIHDLIHGDPLSYEMFTGCFNATLEECICRACRETANAGYLGVLNICYALQPAILTCFKLATRNDDLILCQACLYKSIEWVIAELLTGRSNALFLLALRQFFERNLSITFWSSKISANQHWEANCFITKQLILQRFCAIDEIIGLPQSWRDTHPERLLTYLDQYCTLLPDDEVQVLAAQDIIRFRPNVVNRLHGFLYYTGSCLTGLSLGGSNPFAIIKEMTRVISDECGAYIEVYSNEGKNVLGIEGINTMSYDTFHSEILPKFFSKTLHMLNSIKSCGNSRKFDHRLTIHAILHSLCVLIHDNPNLPLQQSFALAFRNGSVADSLKLVSELGVAYSASVMYKTLNKSAKLHPPGNDYKEQMQILSIKEQCVKLMEIIRSSGCNSDEELQEHGIVLELDTVGISFDNFDEKLNTETKGNIFNFYFSYSFFIFHVLYLGIRDSRHLTVILGLRKRIHINMQTLFEIIQNDYRIYSSAVSTSIYARAVKHLDTTDQRGGLARRSTNSVLDEMRNQVLKPMVNAAIVNFRDFRRGNSKLKYLRMEMRNLLIQNQDEEISKDIFLGLIDHKVGLEDELLKTIQEVLIPKMTPLWEDGHLCPLMGDGQVFNLIIHILATRPNLNRIYPRMGLWHLAFQGHIHSLEEAFPEFFLMGSQLLAGSGVSFTMRDIGQMWHNKDRLVALMFPLILGYLEPHFENWKALKLQNTHLVNEGDHETMLRNSESLMLETSVLDTEFNEWTEFLDFIGSFKLIRVLEAFGAYLGGTDGGRCGKDDMLAISRSYFEILFPLTNQYNQMSYTLMERVMGLELTGLEKIIMEKFTSHLVATDKKGHQMMNDEILEVMNHTLKSLYAGAELSKINSQMSIFDDTRNMTGIAINGIRDSNRKAPRETKDPDRLSDILSDRSSYLVDRKGNWRSFHDLNRLQELLTSESPLKTWIDATVLAAYNKGDPAYPCNLDLSTLQAVSPEADLHYKNMYDRADLILKNSLVYHSLAYASFENNKTQPDTSIPSTQSYNMAKAPQQTNLSNHIVTQERYQDGLRIRQNLALNRIPARNKPNVFRDNLARLMRRATVQEQSRNIDDLSSEQRQSNFKYMVTASPTGGAYISTNKTTLGTVTHQPPWTSLEYFLTHLKLNPISTAPTALDSISTFFRGFARTGDSGYPSTVSAPSSAANPSLNSGRQFSSCKGGGNLKNIPGINVAIFTSDLLLHQLPSKPSGYTIKNLGSKKNSVFACAVEVLKIIASAFIGSQDLHTVGIAFTSIDEHLQEGNRFTFDIHSSVKPGCPTESLPSYQGKRIEKDVKTFRELLHYAGFLEQIPEILANQYVDVAKAMNDSDKTHTLFRALVGKTIIFVGVPTFEFEPRHVGINADGSPKVERIYRSHRNTGRVVSVVSSLGAQGQISASITNSPTDRRLNSTNTSSMRAVAIAMHILRGNRTNKVYFHSHSPESFLGLMYQLHTHFTCKGKELPDIFFQAEGKWTLKLDHYFYRALELSTSFYPFGMSLTGRVFNFLVLNRILSCPYSPTLQLLVEGKDRINDTMGQLYRNLSCVLPQTASSVQPPSSYADVFHLVRDLPPSLTEAAESTANDPSMRINEEGIEMTLVCILIQSNRYTNMGNISWPFLLTNQDGTFKTINEVINEVSQELQRNIDMLKPHNFLPGEYGLAIQARRIARSITILVKESGLGVFVENEYFIPGAANNIETSYNVENYYSWNTVNLVTENATTFKLVKAITTDLFQLTYEGRVCYVARFCNCKGDKCTNCVCVAWRLLPKGDMADLPKCNHCCLRRVISGTNNADQASSLARTSISSRTVAAADTFPVTKRAKNSHERSISIQADSSGNTLQQPPLIPNQSQSIHKVNLKKFIVDGYTDGGAILGQIYLHTALLPVNTMPPTNAGEVLEEKSDGESDDDANDENQQPNDRFRPPEYVYSMSTGSSQNDAADQSDDDS